MAEMAASALVPSPTSTPQSYHQVVSPSLCIPDDPKIPFPVGLLACQRDPFLRELASTVISSSVAQAPPGTNSKRRSKKDIEKVSQAEAAGSIFLEVILRDTVLFPEGGGQPNDIGTFTTEHGDLWDVVDVKRRGGHAVHFVEVTPRRDINDALKEFKPGSTVIVALGEPGFRRRFDHMSIHTAQHLLSAVIEKELTIPTLSWGLTTYPTPSYVELSRDLTPEEITSVQAEANKLVFEGRQVHIEVEELDHDSRTDDPTSATIPSDYTGGVKRTVIIEGVDRNPCCGTHLPSISNLHIFLLPQMEHLSRGSARLYFLAGSRLLSYMSIMHCLLTATSDILSCGAHQVPERVKQIIEERSKMGKRVKDLEAELASSIARELLSRATAEERLILHKHRTDDSNNPLRFLSDISTAFSTEFANNSIRPSSYTIALTSSSSMQMATSTTVIMIFGSDEKDIKRVGYGIQDKLGAKGGGKGLKWSGKFTGVWKEHKEGEVLDGILTGISV